MSYRILVINPGSTSTKIGVYEDEQLLFDKTLRHSAEDIAQFKTIAAQKDWRRNLVMRALREQGIDARTLSAVSGRGGLLRPIRGGTYAVNDNHGHGLHHRHSGSARLQPGRPDRPRDRRRAGHPLLHRGPRGRR